MVTRCAEDLEESMVRGESKKKGAGVGRRVNMRGEVCCVQRVSAQKLYGGGLNKKITLEGCY